MAVSPGPLALKMTPTKHVVSSIKKTSPVTDVTPRPKLALNWDKILKAKGLETPGYEEAVARTLRKIEARKAAALQLREEKARKRKSKGSSGRRRVVR